MLYEILRWLSSIVASSWWCVQPVVTQHHRKLIILGSSRPSDIRIVPKRLTEQRQAQIYRICGF